MSLVPHSSSDVKISVSQTLGVVVIPKQLHRFNPTWRAILAYYAIAYYAHNGTRTAENMTMRVMARVAGVSERTMMRGLAELQKKGAIGVKHRSKKSAAGKKIQIANLYQCKLNDESGDPI